MGDRGTGKSTIGVICSYIISKLKTWLILNGFK